jgi:hypothetical protein
MRSGQVLVRAERDDAGGIDVVVGDVVVPLDMIEVRGVGDAVSLVDIFQIAEQIRIIDDPPDVALEMALLDG